MPAVRQPFWQLIYKGKNITADVTTMITEVTYTDEVSHFSDEMTIKLQDRDRRWQGPWFPTRGDEVALFIGYLNETVLDCGVFQVDEITLDGPPDVMTMKCIAMGVTPSFSTARSVGYENTTLADIAKQIADRQNMELVNVPGDVNVTFQRVTQRHETDIGFLHRLAQEYNYDFTVRNFKRGNASTVSKQIVFYPRKALETAPVVYTITRGLQAIEKFKFTTKTWDVYKTSTVTYLNPETRELLSSRFKALEEVPGNDDLHVITRVESATHANAKAEASLHNANMMMITANLTLEGTALLQAGMNVVVKGFGTFDGPFHIEKTTHRIERAAGYTTTIDIRHL